MRINTRTWLASLASAVALAVISFQPASADDYEWDPEHGYHEEEWYDPGDWFNSDSSVDYENDYFGGYYDNDAYDTGEAWYGNNYYSNDWYDDDTGFDSWYDDDEYGLDDYGPVGVDRYDEFDE